MLTHTKYRSLLQQIVCTERENVDICINVYHTKLCLKILAFFPQLTKHLEDECTECEMTCPLNKLGGCNFKVGFYV